tara:strand:- start:4213 stop:6372 length:2160 start_codon:yes stop_codon:yes gene_type:complete
MARKNPYTQDITPAVRAVEKVKYRQPSYSQQAFNLFAKYIDKSHEAVEDNLKTLQTDFTFEKQKLNKDIANYRRILEIRDDINKNYSGDVRAYARADRIKAYKNQVADYYNARGQEGFKIYDEPDTVFAEYVKPQVDTMVNSLNNAFSTAEKLDFSKDFTPDQVDKLFLQEINKLPNANKKDLFGAVGDLFMGKGLNLQTNYNGARQQVLDRIYSTVPNEELGKLGETLQNLYTTSPELAQKFEQEIVPNVKAGTDQEIISETQDIPLPDGSKQKVNVAFIRYIDTNGKLQTSSKTVTPVYSTESDALVDLDSVSKFVASLNAEGKAFYKQQRESGAAYFETAQEILKNPEYFKDSNFETFKTQVFGPQGQQIYNKIYNQWLVENNFAKADIMNPTAAPKMLEEVKAILDEGKVYKNKAGVEYVDFQDYLQQYVINPFKAGSGSAGTTETIGENSKEVPVSVNTNEGVTRVAAYEINSQSFMTPIFNQSMSGTNPNILDDNNEQISLPVYITQSLGIDEKFEELQEDFNSKAFEMVTKEGVYFNKENPVIVPKESLSAIGINDVQEDIEFGYNLVNGKVLMRPASRTVSFEPIKGRFYLKNFEDVVNAFDLESLSNEELLMLGKMNKSRFREKLKLPEDMFFSKNRFGRQEWARTLSNRIASVLQRRLGEDTDVESYMRFVKPSLEDMPSDEWFAQYIRPLKDEGIRYGAAQRGTFTEG